MWYPVISRSDFSTNVSFIMKGEIELRALKKLQPGPATDDLYRFYDLSLKIVELNTAVLEGVLSHPSAAKILSTGRIVILSDGVSISFHNQPAYY